MLPTEVMREQLTLIANAMGGGTTEVGLFKNDVEMTPDMVLADLEEADYTGYAQVTIEAVGVAWDNADGDAVMSFEGAHFQPTASTVTNTVYGWFLLSSITSVSGTGGFVKAERFDAPVSLLGTEDAVDVIPYLRFGQPVAG